MALKLKLSKTEFEKLSADLQAEYIEDGDEYRLDVTGVEDTGALKRAKDREVQLRKEAEKRARDLEAELSDAKDNTKLRKAESDLAAEQEAHKGTKAKYEGAFNKRLVDAEALSLATKLSKAPALMARVIKERLSVDFTGDEPVLKVTDAEGKISDKFGLADLEKELVANKDYADIIIASKASGGAGQQKPTQPGGGAPNNSDKPADLSSMDPKSLAERMASVIEAKKSAQE